MTKIVKQVLGIDVAQSELVVCLGRVSDNLKSELYAHKVFANDQKGFEDLVTWTKKLTDQSVPVRYVMEATGVYHELLAYYLDAGGHELSIVLPSRISNYARTLSVKTLTDKTASEAIALFGLERTLDTWKAPNPMYRRMRQLTRERDQLTAEKVVLKNQLHAEQKEALANKRSIDRSSERLTLIDRQLAEVLADLKELVAQRSEVSGIVRLLSSIVGVGFITAATVLAETNGFDLIRNKRQLTSYAGLDVREKQSGTSVKAKPRISKKGNKYLRKAMYMPALTAIRYDERWKGVYARLVSRHGIKMKAAVAVQRRVLEMMFTVYKSGIAYDKNYLNGEVTAKAKKLGDEHRCPSH
jgi:transposase